MPTRMTVYSDFIWPYCYVGQDRVDRLSREYDVEIEWRAFELHPGIPPEGQELPWTPEQRAQRGGNFARLADEAGLPRGDRTHWYDSTPAHEASEWAREQGQEEAFRHKVYRAYFVDNENIASPDVLARFATELGLDADDLRAALAEGRYREQIQDQYEQARQVGVTGVPTFVAGGYAVVGAQPYELFQRLMETIGGERRPQETRAWGETRQALERLKGLLER